MEMYEKLSDADLPDFIMSAYRGPAQGLRVFFFREEQYVSPEKEQQNAERLLQCQKMSPDLLTVTVVLSEETNRLSCISKNNKIRALEFMDFVTGEFGNCDGDACNARGEISTMLIKLQQGESYNLEQYFLDRLMAYFQECEIVCPWEYGEKELELIRKLQVYEKKEVPWAMVKTTDIVEAGTMLKVKTLENTTGVSVMASEDVYMMIGIEGEVYNIQREKFEHSYQVSEEPLDIFEKMTSYIPTVEVAETGEYIAIDTMARLSYPRSGKRIYARKLNRRTKVFSDRQSDDYFIGKSGDYLAVRQDDLSDIYIIQGEIFKNTYQKADASEK